LQNLKKVRAIWFVAATVEEKGGRTKPVTTPEIYNLADKEDTSNYCYYELNNNNNNIINITININIYLLYFILFYI